MKIDLNVGITDLKSTPIKLTEDKVFRVKDAAVTALLSTIRGDETMSGKDKFELYQLAVKLENSDGEVELNAEAVTLIKKRVGGTYPPLITGRVYDTLEGNLKK